MQDAARALEGPEHHRGHDDPRHALLGDVRDGATDTDTFVAFVREGLVPVLGPGQVVVLDNLSAHHAPEVRRLVESAGATLLPLPPYSPDLNPIEQAISKVKAVLRKLARRDVGGLLDGLDEALRSIRPDDALGYIAHSGYAIP